ncbi:hypothetical protein EMIT047CA2_120141 [Pseudomonas soli]
MNVKALIRMLNKYSLGGAESVSALLREDRQGAPPEAAHRDGGHPLGGQAPSLWELACQR